MTSLSDLPTPSADKHLRHPKYRPDIDGLRAIAVLSVVGFHAFPALLQGGFVGVDVFFVISGFLISSIIFASLETNNFSFREFYVRRINRIFPALLIMLAATWSFGWISLFTDEYMQLGKHIAAGSAFLSNFVLLGEVGYFDNSAETKLLLHLWSLGVEEQFYLLWPLMIWAAWKTRFNALALIALVGVASFILNVSIIHSNPTQAFYSPQTRFWELVMGSLLAYLTLHSERFLKIWNQRSVTRNIASLTGLILLAVAFAITSKNNQFPGWWALLPTTGALLIIAAGPFAWFNRVILSNRILVACGLISYPLYLWHWPILTFARIIESGTPSWQVRLIAVLLAIGLAWLTYRLLELPLRKKPQNARSIVLLLLIGIVGVTGYATFKTQGIPSRAMIQDSQVVNDQFVSTTDWKYAKNETCLTRYKFADANKLPWWFCSTNRDEPPTTVILGNSYANHLYPGIIHAEPAATVLSIGTCDPGYTVNGDFPGNPCSLDYPKRQNDFIDNIIRTSGTVKTVIIDGLFLFKEQEYAESLISRISYMDKLGIKIVIFVPHFVLDYNIRSCFSRPFKQPERDCTISLQERQRLLGGFAGLKERLAEKVNNLYFFDQNDVFCTDEKCSMIINGMPAYRDQYFHYSEFASDQVGKAFVRWAAEKGIELQ